MEDANLNALLSISPSALLASILFGIIGWWMFWKGKRETNHQVMGIGMLLMIYPMFTMNPVADWSIGTVLCGLAYYYW